MCVSVTLNAIMRIHYNALSVSAFSSNFQYHGITIITQSIQCGWMQHLDPFSLACFVLFENSIEMHEHQTTTLWFSEPKINNNN